MNNKLNTPSGVDSANLVNSGMKSLYNDVLNAIENSGRVIKIESDIDLLYLKSGLISTNLSKLTDIKVSIYPGSIKVSDIRNAKDLPNLIAGGFFLLHKDLIEQVSKKSYENDFSTSTDSKSSSPWWAKAGLAALLISGVLAAVGIEGLVSLIKTGHNATKKFSEVVDKVITNIKSEDIANNDDIKKAVTTGIGEFVVSYFSGLGEALTKGEEFRQIITKKFQGVADGLVDLFLEITGNNSKERNPVVSFLAQSVNTLIDFYTDEDGNLLPKYVQNLQSSLNQEIISKITFDFISNYFNTIARTVGDKVKSYTKDELTLQTEDGRGAVIHKTDVTKEAISFVTNNIQKGLDELNKVDIYSEEPYSTQWEAKKEEVLKAQINYISDYFSSISNIFTKNQLRDEKWSGIGEALGSFFTGINGSNNPVVQKLESVISSVLNRSELSDSVISGYLSNPTVIHRDESGTPDKSETGFSRIASSIADMIPGYIHILSQSIIEGDISVVQSAFRGEAFKTFWTHVFSKKSYSTISDKIIDTIQLIMSGINRDRVQTIFLSKHGKSNDYLNTLISDELPSLIKKYFSSVVEQLGVFSASKYITTENYGILNNMIDISGILQAAFDTRNFDQDQFNININRILSEKLTDGLENIFNDSLDFNNEDKIEIKESIKNSIKNKFDSSSIDITINQGTNELRNDLNKFKEAFEKYVEYIEGDENKKFNGTINLFNNNSNQATISAKF